MRGFGPFLAGCIAALILAGAGCSNEKRFQYAVRGRLLGAPYHATVVGEREIDRHGHRELSQRLQTRLAEILLKADLDASYSELARLNRAPAGVTVPVSDEILELLTLAQAVADQTQGAFDVTIAPIEAAWGVREGSELKPPADRQLREAAARCGIRKIEISTSDSTVVKAAAAVVVDLSAVLHGYAADQLSEVLSEQGWPDHVVQVGEEVQARGSDRLDRPWKISIQRGVDAPEPRVVLISNRAVAVAGNSDWLRGPDGKLYSRHIDPRTARPLENNLLSAAVVHERGPEADAYARALLVLGEEEGLRFAEERNLAALLLVESDGVIREITSQAFAGLAAGPAAVQTARSGRVAAGALRP